MIILGESLLPCEVREMRWRNVRIDQLSCQSGVCKPPLAFESQRSLVPELLNRPANSWQSHLRTPGQAPTKNRLDPGILPGEAGYFQFAAEFLRCSLRQLEDIFSFGVEIHHPVLEIADTSGPSSWRIDQRPHILEVQPHGEPLRIALFVGVSDVTEAAWA